MGQQFAGEIYGSDFPYSTLKYRNNRILRPYFSFGELKSSQTWVDRFTSVNQSVDGTDRMIKHCLLFRIQLDFNNLLNTAFTDNRRRAT